MSRPIPEEPTFDLACRGFVGGKAARKILFALNEKDAKSEILLPAGTIEEPPAMIGTFLAGLSNYKQVQAPDKRDEDNWFWHNPSSGDVQRMNGFPNPRTMEIDKYQLRAVVKKTGYVKVELVAMPENIEIKEENPYNADRIKATAKLELQGEGINKKAIAEAAVEIYEIYEICEETI